MSPLWDQLIELDAGSEIAALLDHPAVAVRYCAAARLHKIDWRRARAVMEPIAAEPAPLGIFARRLLDRWANGAVERRRVDLRFGGTVIETDYLGACSGRFIPLGVNPLFAVTVDVDEPPDDGPFGRGVSTFAIHSVVQCFYCSADEIAGARVRFEVAADERAGEWRFYSLRGRVV